MSVVGRAALITGAASGLGLSFSRALLEKGYGVSMIDVNRREGNKQVRILQDTFGRETAIFTQCDVSDGSQLASAFKKAFDHFGRLDVVCNNAGVSSRADWHKTIDINLNAVIHGTFLALEYMSTQRGGHGGLVVNTASFGGLVPMSFEPTYSASKHGVIGFTRSLFRLVDSDGVRVNALCPSFTDTPMVVEGRKNPDFDKMLEVTGFLSIDEVTRGLLQLIRDEDKSGEVLTVTMKHGLRYERFRYEAAKL